jgi:hypothetical protein
MMHFKNLSLSLLLMGLLSLTPAMAMEGSEEEYTIVHTPCQKTDQELKDIGHSYIAFLQKMGGRDEQVTQEDVDQLHAPQCKKIVNRSVWCRTSSELTAQLNEARNATGGWSITKTVLVTSSATDGTCTIQFDWEGNKIGAHTTIKVLSLNEVGKVYQIDEVFAKLEDGLGVK